MKLIVRSDTNSATAQHPLRDTAGQCLSASAVLCPPSSPSLFMHFGRRGIFFELNGRWDSGGFPLREETGGILVPIQNAWSRTLYYLFSVRDYGVHPRHSPRTFPLGLLAPRCLGLALLLALPLCGAGARAPCCLGEGRNPSPSFASSRQGSTNRLSQPPFSFSYRLYVVSLSLLDFCIAR